MTIDLLEFGKQQLHAQPFSALLGAQLTRFDAGHCELRLPLRRDLQQQHGFAHGAVVSYCADNALAGAAHSVTGAPVVTSEFKINYLRPAMGDALVARAAVVHAGRTQLICRCDVFAVSDSQEKLCAVAQGTIALLQRAGEQPKQTST